MRIRARRGLGQVSETVAGDGVGQTSADASPGAARAAPPPSAAEGVRAAPPSAVWRHTVSSLANRDFLFLWLAMAFSMSGFQMQMITQVFLVYYLTGSAKILAVVSAGWALPMLGAGTVWRRRRRPC